MEATAGAAGADCAARIACSISRAGPATFCSRRFDITPLRRRRGSDAPDARCWRRTACNLPTVQRLTPSQLPISPTSLVDRRWTCWRCRSAPGASTSSRPDMACGTCRNCTMAIREIHRVLAPGGRLLSLDFNRPGNAAVRGVVPRLSDGRRLAAGTGAASAIPTRIATFPNRSGITRAPRAWRGCSRAEGFEDVRVIPVLFGLMAIHVAPQTGVLSSVARARARARPAENRGTSSSLIASGVGAALDWHFLIERA